MSDSNITTQVLKKSMGSLQKADLFFNLIFGFLFWHSLIRLKTSNKKFVGFAHHTNDQPIHSDIAGNVATDYQCIPIFNFNYL